MVNIARGSKIPQLLWHCCKLLNLFRYRSRIENYTKAPKSCENRKEFK
nr:MAG TPA: rich Immunoreceptor tyrosine-based activation motif [Caudoviricetes sp.]